MKAAPPTWRGRSLPSYTENQRDIFAASVRRDEMRGCMKEGRGLYRAGFIYLISFLHFNTLSGFYLGGGEIFPPNFPAFP